MGNMSPSYFGFADLHRTFPENIYFANDASESKQAALRNVLIAFAKHNPDIGYCQGLNYVVGMMLIVLKDEEKAFFLLEKLTKQILVGKSHILTINLGR